MQYTHLHVGDDGESHFGDSVFEGTLDERGATLYVDSSASNARLISLPPLYDQNWFAETAILAVMVEGHVAITMIDGETRHFQAGDVMRVDDKGTRGHLLRAGDTGAMLVLVRLTN